MVENKTIFIISIIALITSIGIPTAGVTLGDVLINELKDYFICNLDDNIKEFKGGISATTAYSGYPYIDSRKGAIRCGTTDNKGKWKSLSNYAKEIGVDPYDLLESSNEKQYVPSSNIEGKRWLCSPPPVGCVKIT